MNNIYLHTNKNVRQTHLLYFAFLIPLILFGFYKNGILVYLKGNINIIEMFKPLILPFACYYLNYFVTKFYENKFKKVSISHELMGIYGMIICMTLPVNINIVLSLIIIPVMTILYLILFKKNNLNYMALVILVILLLNYFLNGYTSVHEMFLNNYEKVLDNKYSLYKELVGFNYSGIAASNLFLIIIFAMATSIYSNYKVTIPIYLMISYIGIGLLISLFTNDFNSVFSNLFNYSTIFIIFMVSTETTSSPYTKSGMITYGLLIGACFWILSFLPCIFALLVSIILLSLLSQILNIMFRKAK